MSRRIRWALVGCGDIAEKATAPAINGDPNSVLHAAVRRDAVKGREFARRHHARVFYDNVEEAVRDAEVDAVYVATPVGVHREHTIAACEAGKHVLCEKPMAMNAEECDDMVEAARRNGVTLGVSYYRRLYAKVVRVTELLAQGVIGRPVMVRIDLRGWYDPAADDPKRWRVQKSQSGGGVLLDVGSHRLDLLVNFFGLPDTVSGRAETLAHAYDVDDSAFALMNYAGGLTALASFLWSTRCGLDEFEIIGTTGRIAMIPLDSPNLTVTAGGKVFEEQLPPPANRHELLIKEFSRALLEKREPIVSGVEGRKTTLIMDAMYRSSARPTSGAMRSTALVGREGIKRQG